MDSGPTIREMRERGVAVEDVELAREEDNDEGEGHDKEAEKAGFGKVGA